jgi:hypothetical protein
MYTRKKQKFSRAYEKRCARTAKFAITNTPWKIVENPNKIKQTLAAVVAQNRKTHLHSIKIR